MSDGLIEKFQGLLTIDRRKVSPELTRDEMKEILSALKTLRGIEGLTDTEGNSVLFVHKNADFNGLPNCCIEVTTDWDQRQIYRADTFAECVDAAITKSYPVIQHQQE